MKKIRVCLWATTLQANIWSLAKYLSGHNRFEVIVVTEDAQKWHTEPIAQVVTPTFTVMEKDDPDTIRYLKKEFQPLVTVVDNHYPPQKLSPFLINVWHGFGWKGPEDRKAFSNVFKNVKKLTGISADQPNPYFRFVCGGNTNFEYRIHITGFAKENVLPLGQAFTDDIVNNHIRKEDILKFYPDTFANRKVCLFAPTWHFGRIFSHLGDDIDILERIFNRLDQMDCALILRMHDKKRFDADYLEALETLASRHPLVMLKYKDTDRDNLLDMCVSDIMMSNYSSILTFFYGTFRPSIHIYPVNSDSETSYYRVWKNGAVRVEKAPEHNYIWSLDPHENGGLVAHSVEDIEAAIDKAVTEPDCCQEKSAAFISKHTAPYGGNVCKNITEAMIQMVDNTPLPQKSILPWR